MFWGNYRSKVSHYEQLKIISVTGGVPRSLKEIDLTISAEDNIKRLCFESSGILYQDFDQIFTDLFSEKSIRYKRIISKLVNGPFERESLIEKLDLAKNRQISKDLDNLIKSGFIQRDFAWNIHNNILPKLSVYRLSDNYLRFFLKYIDPNRDKIDKGFFREVHLSSFLGWSSLMGVQIENLVLNNRLLVLEYLGIPPEIIVNDGAYFQSKTLRSPGCQIDYLIQTKLSELYVVEVKFHKNELGASIIEDSKTKIKKLIRPKNGIAK